MRLFVPLRAAERMRTRWVVLLVVLGALGALAAWVAFQYSWDQGALGERRAERFAATMTLPTDPVRRTDQGTIHFTHVFVGYPVAHATGYYAPPRTPLSLAEETAAIFRAEGRPVRGPEPTTMGFEQPHDGWFVTTGVWPARSCYHWIAPDLPDKTVVACSEELR